MRSGIKLSLTAGAAAYLATSAFGGFAQQGAGIVQGYMGDQQIDAPLNSMKDSKKVYQYSEDNTTMHFNSSDFKNAPTPEPTPLPPVSTPVPTATPTPVPTATPTPTPDRNLSPTTTIGCIFYDKVGWRDNDYAQCTSGPYYGYNGTTTEDGHYYLAVIHMVNFLSATYTFRMYGYQNCAGSPTLINTQTQSFSVPDVGSDGRNFEQALYRMQDETRPYYYRAVFNRNDGYSCYDIEVQIDYTHEYKTGVTTVKGLSHGIKPVDRICEYKRTFNFNSYGNIATTPYEKYDTDTICIEWQFKGNFEYTSTVNGLSITFTDGPCSAVKGKTFFVPRANGTTNFSVCGGNIEVKVLNDKAYVTYTSPAL